MLKKKQITFQNSIPGKFIPRNILPSGSAFPPRANDNRFNAKMAELLASSSGIHDENEVVCTNSSQDNVLSTEITSMNCSEILRKPNDNHSIVSTILPSTEQKSQPVTFGQLKQAKISLTPTTITEDKTASHQFNADKHPTILQSPGRDHTSDSTSITQKSSGKHQLNKERLYYSPSLEKLFEEQHIVSQTKNQDDQQPSLTVDEILARYYSKVKSPINTESHLKSADYPNTTSFYIHPSTPKWNHSQNNQQVVTLPPQLVLNQQSRNRSPPPSYSVSVARTYRTTSAVNPVQHLIRPSTSTSSLEHLFTENSSSILPSSSSPFGLTLTNPTSNNSVRPPPPRYQSPISNVNRTHPTLSSTNDSLIHNQQSKTSPTQSSGGFDREFSRLLYGKDARRTRQKKQKRKAFSDPVKKSVEEATQSVGKTHRRVTTHLNKTDTMKEEESEVQLERPNYHKDRLNFLPQRRFQPQLSLMGNKRESIEKAIVSANPLIKRRIPSFLRVYTRAPSSTDVLLQWDLFNLSELESFYTMMIRLYKNENLARVQLFEAYRSTLLAALASKTSLTTDDENEAIRTPL